MKELELALLKFWKKQDIEWLYKYKHSVKVFIENPNLHRHELIKDISSGTMFTDIPDLANFSREEDMYPEDIKVHIEARQRATKDCRDCAKYKYEYGMEDNDEYCMDGIDLNSIPEDDTHFSCPNHKVKELK